MAIRAPDGANKYGEKKRRYAEMKKKKEEKSMKKEFFSINIFSFHAKKRRQSLSEMPPGLSDGWPIITRATSHHFETGIIASPRLDPLSDHLCNYLYVFGSFKINLSAGF